MHQAAMNFITTLEEKNPEVRNSVISMFKPNLSLQIPNMSPKNIKAYPSKKDND